MDSYMKSRSKVRRCRRISLVQWNTEYYEYIKQSSDSQYLCTYSTCMYSLTRTLEVLKHFTKSAWLRGPRWWRKDWGAPAKRQVADSNAWGIACPVMWNYTITPVYIWRPEVSSTQNYLFMRINVVRLFCSRRMPGVKNVGEHPSFLLASDVNRKIL